MKTLGRTGYDGNSLRYMNTLSSGLDWMLECGFSKSELVSYVYPGTAEFEQHDLQIVYLGWFLGDWSLVNNAAYSCGTGLEIRTDGVEKTGDLYGVTALDEDFTPVNQLILVAAMCPISAWLAWRLHKACDDGQCGPTAAA